MRVSPFTELAHVTASFAALIALPPVDDEPEADPLPLPLALCTQGRFFVSFGFGRLKQDFVFDSCSASGAGSSRVLVMTFGAWLAFSLPLLLLRL